MSNLGGISNAAAFGVMGLAALASVTFLADVYTTMIGLEHGFIEQNPLARWMFKKFGISFSTFLIGSGMLLLGGFLTNYGAAKADVYFGVIAGSETFFAVRNYLRLKTAGIIK